MQLVVLRLRDLCHLMAETVAVHVSHACKFKRLPIHAQRTHYRAPYSMQLAQVGSYSVNMLERVLFPLSPLGIIIMMSSFVFASAALLGNEFSDLRSILLENGAVYMWNILLGDDHHTHICEYNFPQL